MINRVSHITTVHFRYDVRIMYKYCQTLSEKFETTLFVADGKGDETINHLRVVDVGKPSFGRIGRLLLGNLKMLQRLLKRKTDILHFHDPELLLLAILLRIMGKKVIFDMHENLPLEILTKDYIPKIFRIVLSKTLKLFQNFALIFIPVIFAEESYRKHFLNAKRHQTILNYPLVRDLEMVTPSKKLPNSFGYMGGVTKERGALVTLSCAEFLHKAGYNIKLSFVGPVQEEVSKSELFNTSVQKELATFHGRLKPHDGWSKMAECNAGLAILQDSPNFVESYPTKIFEYMLLGLPIIVSNFPLYKAIVEESNCGIAVTPSSEKEVTQAMQWMLNNPEEATQMGLRGKRKAMEKYNWESEFSKLIDFYNEITG